MPRENAIQFEGTVIELLPRAIYRVEIPNGHRILAHASAELRRGGARLLVGDQATVEVSPYDLSQGRIIAKHEA
jgi:translation initiation factor IF-1